MRIRATTLISVMCLSLVIAACSKSSPSRSAPRFAISPTSGLLDSTVSVSLSGVKSGATTTVSASAKDASGIVWSSSAKFVASAAGTVSLAQAPVSGSYAGADPMGLFDVMTPSNSSGPGDFGTGPAGYTVTLTAAVAGKTVATAQVRRTTEAALISSTPIQLAATGVYGELEEPVKTNGLKPAVVLIGGSEGGNSTTFTAKMLAAHGFPALALAYFKEPGLPATLSRIPLEYFAKALRVLRAEPGVDPHHVFIYGDSRGSEAALLTGAHYPDLVNGVIAGSPSSVANVGFPDTNEPAWTFGGKPVPTVPATSFGDPDAAPAIPVEQIKGPVFTVCGGDDLIWPSCAYATVITARLNAHSFAFQQVALSYPGAGHFVGSMACCFSATARSMLEAGGTVQATTAGERAAWGRLLQFLAAQ